MEEREKERESEDREWGVATKEERHKDDMRGGRERERGKESGEGKWQMAVAMVDGNGGW